MWLVSSCLEYLGGCTQKGRNQRSSVQGMELRLIWLGKNRSTRGENRRHSLITCINSLIVKYSFSVVQRLSREWFVVRRLLLVLLLLPRTRERRQDSCTHRVRWLFYRKSCADDVTRSTSGSFSHPWSLAFESQFQSNDVPGPLFLFPPPHTL